MPERIFVSSTWVDLQPERLAVERAIHEMEARYGGMEYFGSRDDTPKEVSLAEVARSTIYLGIFAHRYGTVDKESGCSLTELEYQKATGLGFPCLIYFKDEEVPVPPAFVEDRASGRTKLRRLKAELLKKHVVYSFKSPEDLARRVVLDLQRLLNEIRGNSLSKRPEAADTGADKAELQKLQDRYLTYLREKYEYLDLKGIEPRVGGQVISLRLEDVFISLEAEEERPLVAQFAEEELTLERDEEMTDQEWQQAL
jgi:hypothetical protein